MNFKIQRTVTTTITLEQVDDLLTCAFEGGSNYWYTIKRTIEPTEILYKTDIFEDGKSYLTPALNPGGALVIIDREEDEEDAKEYILDLKSIENGLIIMSEDQYSFHMNNLLTENEDAETGDVFLQLCLFGKIVFG